MYTITSMMNDIKNFTIFAGVAMTSGEIVAQYIKYRKNQVEKLAKSKLGTIKSIDSKMGDDGLIINNQVQLKENYDF